MKSLQGTIGLIADSHGDVSALLKAINALSVLKIHDLVHLGDFFDSVNTRTINEILFILQEHQVLTVKGNNDYQVEKMLDDGNLADFIDQNEKCRAFLNKTPIFQVVGEICFSHSMPFDSIRSFYEPVDNGTTEKAAVLFEKTPHQVLFCGHSHKPVFFRYNAGKITREQMVPGCPVGINMHERYIFIVGSAENGECGFYDTNSSFYERITF